MFLRIHSLRPKCLLLLETLYKLFVFCFAYLFIHRFMSNYFENGPGFQLRYESSNVSQWSYGSGSCGGNFTTPHGILTSPSYPDHYPNDVDCIFLISQPNGTVILLNFMSLDIDSYIWDTNCNYKDSLVIRDGPSVASPPLDTLCGSEIPASIQSSQNQVWMK